MSTIVLETDDADGVRGSVPLLTVTFVSSRPPLAAETNIPSECAIFLGGLHPRLCHPFGPPREDT